MCLIRIRALGVTATQVQRETPDPEGKMTRLMMILFSMISTALAGSFIVAVLTMGYDTLQPILLAAAAGFALAVPVSWFVAKQIAD
jgi:predicted PurR-regulated permease PerM